MELEADGDAVLLEEMGGQKRMVIIQRNGEMREMRVQVAVETDLEFWT